MAPQADVVDVVQATAGRFSSPDRLRRSGTSWGRLHERRRAHEHNRSATVRRFPPLFPVCASRSSLPGVKVSTLPIREPVEHLSHCQRLETELAVLFVIHTLTPSKAIAVGPAPTDNVARETPSLARSTVTVPSPAFGTQTLAPSKAIPSGIEPTVNVPNKWPSAARSFVTLLLPLLAIQMAAPSKTASTGVVPTGNVPRIAPSDARSFVTLPPAALGIQTFAPSNAPPEGLTPIGKVWVVPSGAILVASSSVKFGTQMFNPSKITPVGVRPTEIVWTSEPSLARSSVTELPTAFATQMFVPSNATAPGMCPVAKDPRI